MVRNWVTYIFILLTISLFAQQYKHITASTTPGFLLAHRADIKNLAAHNYGIELGFEKEQWVTEWGENYNKPSIGYSLIYYNLGKESTGHALGALAQVKLKVANLESTSLHFRMGGGISYLTKTFDLEENLRNQAIGSHLNGTMQFSLLGHTMIRNKRDFLEYGLSITHYSNAAFKVPNLGYNIPSVTLRYGLGLPTEQVEVDSFDAYILPLNYGLHWRVTSFAGRKQANLSDPVNFTNYGVQFRGMYYRNLVRAWRFGIDFTTDKNYAYAKDNQVDLTSLSFGQQLEIGLAGGYQWRFSNVDVVGEIGAYIYRPGDIKTTLNQRLGAIYNISDHVSVQGMLRFHEGVADFFELGAGYTL